MDWIIWIIVIVLIVAIVWWLLNRQLAGNGQRTRPGGEQGGLSPADNLLPVNFCPDGRERPSAAAATAAAVCLAASSTRTVPETGRLAEPEAGPAAAEAAPLAGQPSAAAARPDPEDLEPDIESWEAAAARPSASSAGGDVDDWDDDGDKAEWDAQWSDAGSSELALGGWHIRIRRHGCGSLRSHCRRDRANCCATGRAYAPRRVHRPACAHPPGRGICRGRGHRR